MKSVSDILRAKGDSVWTIPPDATVFDALRLMADKNIGALVVVEQGTVKGMLSERDYARKVTLHGKSSKETRVREIMTSNVYSLLPEDRLEDCMSLMTNRHIRHLPVIAEGRLLGLISIGDIVKVIIADKETLIKDLENYITGKR